MAHVKTNGKMTSSHTTATDAAIVVINAAHAISDVTKISIGIIKPVRGAQRRLKFKPITGGTLAVVGGNGAVQEIYIYTTNVPATQEQISKTFNQI